MKKLLTLIMIFLSVLLVACNHEIPQKDLNFEPTYEMKFVVDGEIYHQLDVTLGSEFNYPDEPTKEGYTFVGWYIDNQEADSNIVTSDYLTLHAHFVSNIKSYLVLLYDGDKILYNSQIERGNKIEIDNSLTSKEGYTFKGWYLEPEFEIEFDIENSSINEELSLYGKWEQKSYQVKILNQNSVFNQQTVLHGKVLGTVNTTISGFTFGGFYTDSNFMTSFNVATPIKSDLTIYGKWTMNVVTPDPTDPDPDPTTPDPTLPSDFSGYYASLNGLSGTALVNEVTRMVKNTGKAIGKTEHVKEADAWQGRTYNIYDGLGTYGNREHTVPATHFRKAGLPEDDLHNLRAAVVNTNSTRGSYAFGEGSGKWNLIGTKFYPGDEHVGDVARIVLYITLRYNLKIDLVGNLNMFLKWHEQDPVSEFEIVRNGRIYSMQQNRNPFIDYPGLVSIIYGPRQVSSSYVSVPDFILIDQTYSFNTIYVQ